MKSVDLRTNLPAIPLTNLLKGGIIAFHRPFVTLTGSINAALFLSQACYWSRIKNGDWFWKTQDQWEEETALSRKEQETCRRILRKLSILKEKKEGIPCKLLFRIDFSVLYSLLGDISVDTPKYVPDGHSGMSSADIHNNEEKTTSETTNLSPSPSAPEGFALDPNPPSPKKKPSKADPRHRQFMELIFKAHKHFTKIEPIMGPVVGNKLKALLKSAPKLDEKGFRAMLTNYHESENHNPADSPAFYVHKLPNYVAGPLNKWGRPSEAS